MSNKIFLIEEDINIASGLESLLSLTGFTVQVADTFDVDEVTHRIRFFNPDFIIMEPDMRRGSGLSILYNLKSDIDIVHKPIFIFTGTNKLEVKKKTESMGAEYYFHKNDHSLADFTAKVKKIIKNILK